MTPALRRAAVVAVGVLTASACSSGHKTASLPEPGHRPTTETQQQALTKAGDLSPQEGSVLKHKFVVYPDKLRVTFVKADVLPAKFGSSLTKGQTLVRVTFDATYNGPKAIPYGKDHVPFSVLYGANRYKAEQDAGYAGDTTTTSLFPSQLTHGATSRLVMSFDVPTADLSALAVTLDMYPGELSPITFTDIGKVLKR